MPACVTCMGTGIIAFSRAVPAPNSTVIAHLGRTCDSCLGTGETVLVERIDFTPHITYLRQRLGDRSPALDPAAIEPVIALLEREARLQQWAEAMSSQALEGYAVRFTNELKRQLEIQVPPRVEEPAIPWHKTPDPFE